MYTLRGEKISLLIDKIRKQLVEKVIKLVDSEKDGHTDRRKISLTYKICSFSLI